MNPDAERELVYSQMKEEGAVSMYLVSSEWWTAWDLYTSGDSPKPSKINNQPLLTGHSLKQPLSGNEFKSLPEAPWKQLLERYGGGPEIEIFFTNKVPDFNVVFLEVARHNDFIGNTTEWNGFYVPLQMSLHQLKVHLCAKLFMPPQGTTLHRLAISSLGSHAMHCLEHSEHEELGSLGLATGTQVLLEDTNALEESLEEIEKLRNLSSGGENSWTSTEERNETEFQGFAQTRTDRELVESQLRQAYGRPKVKLWLKPLSLAHKGLKQSWASFQNKTI